MRRVAKGTAISVVPYTSLIEAFGKRAKSDSSSAGGIGALPNERSVTLRVSISAESASSIMWNSVGEPNMNVSLSRSTSSSSERPVNSGTATYMPWRYTVRQRTQCRPTGSRAGFPVG